MAVSTIKVKLSAADKARMSGQDFVVRLLSKDKGDVASVNAALAYVCELYWTLNQQGEFKGKRPSGATTHDYGDIADAIVTAGSKQLVKIG